jgi:phospholipid-transporting ATPase
MLLRGSSLRNTEFIYGLVVYTGHESKVMKNSVNSRAKFSKLELATNTYIFMIVCMQFVISLIGAIFNTVWQNVNSVPLDSYLFLSNGAYTPVVNFFV